MKIANVQEMVFIDKSIINVVSHLYTWYYSYKMVAPQVILNFKWSSNEESSHTNKSSRLSNGWPMQWLRERCPTNWYQGQRSYVWYLKSYTNSVIPTYEVVSIKNARFKYQPSTPMQPFVSRDAHLLWKLMTKGGEISTKIWNMQNALGRSWIWTWIWTKREQHWEIEKYQKS